MPPKQLLPIKKDGGSNYRYKMPEPLLRKIQSKGGKTVILNAGDLSKSLNRSIESLFQWFQFQGGKCALNKDSGQLTMNGTHEKDEVLDSLYEYINHFILCPVCSNPETTIEKNNQNVPCYVCRACGETTPCPNFTDNINSRMLEWFISHAHIEKGNTKEITPSARKDQPADTHKIQPNADSSTGEYLNVDELNAILRSLEPSQSSEPTQQFNEEFNQFFQTYITKIHSDESDDAVYQYYTKTADEFSWNQKKRIAMLFAALFQPDDKDPSKDHVNDLLDCLIKRRGLIFRFTPNETAQKAFLTSIINFIDSLHPELRTSAPIIFYTLYENEIIEEEVFEAYAKGKGKGIQRILQITADFFDWMHNAQYEPIAPVAEESEPEPEPEQKTEAKEEDDINIDDI